MNKVVICGVNTATLPKLSASEQDVLMRRIKLGDTNAKQQFVYANMRLVLSVVQKFMHRNASSDDMFQVGCVGLIKAVDNFDTTLNVKFSTYAVPMIMGEIRRYLRDNNAVRVSRSLRDIAYRALQSREQLTNSLQREPSLEEIAEALGEPYLEVACAIDAITEPLSLSEPIYSDDQDSLELGEHLADTYNTVEKWIDRVALLDALETLDEREKRILLLRYYMGRTQVEVSDDVGISQAQVSRLEKNALRMIKKFLS